MFLFFFSLSLGGIQEATDQCFSLKEISVKTYPQVWIKKQQKIPCANSGRGNTPEHLQSTHNELQQCLASLQPLSYMKGNRSSTVTQMVDQSHFSQW